MTTARKIVWTSLSCISLEGLKSASACCFSNKLLESLCIEQFLRINQFQKADCSDVSIFGEPAFIFRIHTLRMNLFFHSHSNTIPNKSAELRSKRQTELETWGMVPKAGPDTGTARNQRPVVAPLTRQERGSSSERALSCSPAQRAWEYRRVPGKEEFE